MDRSRKWMDGWRNGAIGRQGRRFMESQMGGFFFLSLFIE